VQGEFCGACQEYRDRQLLLKRVLDALQTIRTKLEEAIEPVQIALHDWGEDDEQA
jgi:hypothetical protein